MFLICHWELHIFIQFVVSTLICDYIWPSLVEMNHLYCLFICDPLWFSYQVDMFVSLCRFNLVTCLFQSHTRAYKSVLCTCICVLGEFLTILCVVIRFNLAIYIYTCLSYTKTYLWMFPCMSLSFRAFYVYDLFGVFSN